MLYCRICLKGLIVSKFKSPEFQPNRIGCKRCPKPHPCEKLIYCPIHGLLEDDDQPRYSMKNVIEELRSIGIEDVSPSLLKHYDNLGLINPKKTEKGHRRFSDNDIREIIFIKLLTHYQIPGFALDEIKYYLDIVKNNDVEKVRTIFGKIEFSNDDFLIDKKIDNYSKNGDESLYWWTDHNQGPEILQKTETRMAERSVWGYVYKNLDYDKNADILKYKLYLYPERQEAHETKIKRFLEFMHLYILFLCSKVELYKIKETLGAIDKFSLWVDDRQTDFNKIVKIRIHIYTILRPIDLEIDAEKGKITLSYTFNLEESEKHKYRDYYLEDNYDTSKDGMHRIFL